MSGPYSRSVSLSLLCVILAVASLLTPHQGAAQIVIKTGIPDFPISAEQRRAVIDSALQELAKSYIYPEKAKEMEKAIRARQQNKEYDGITSSRSLAATLTEHLQEISHDKHLLVIPILPQRNTLPKDRMPNAVERKRLRANGTKDNFGFEKVERLEGNVGYLLLRGFLGADGQAAGAVAAAAMNFLANTDALIIDLRQNSGGTNRGLSELLPSYFFSERTHLGDVVWREPKGELIEQSWTLPHLAGKRYVDKDVYLLTSKRTFSAAEGFAYNLQALKRVTVVGETTGGGAHPIRPQSITDHFVIFVPCGRPVNPITKTDWEGTGVKPDIEVPADLALKTAHLAALKNLLRKAESDGQSQESLKQYIEKAAKELDELKKKPLPP